MAAQPVVLERDPTPQGVRTPTGPVTEQTVQKMCAHIRAAQSDPIVQSVASRATSHQASPAAKLSALWMWVKHCVRFVQDDTLIRQLLNESDHFELLIAPPVLLRMSDPRGDCDDFTMLLDALARACGFEVGIVTLACDRRRPGEYSHVYGCAWLPDGMLCPLDASHGKYPGWEVPGRDVQRKTIWNLDGRIVSDEPGPAAIGSNGGSAAVGSTNAGSGDASGLGAVPAGLPTISGMPVIDTGLPIIGTIDFQNPLEWLTLGGAAASLLLPTSGTTKIAGFAGFMGVRYMLQQMWGTW